MNRSEAGKLGAIKTAELLKQKKLQRIEEYNKNPKICKECSNSIPYNKRGSNDYCSRSCSAKNSNRVRNLPSNPRKPDKNKEYFCVGCSNKIESSKHIKKFCSLSCQQDFQRNNAIQNNTLCRKAKG